MSAINNPGRRLLAALGLVVLLNGCAMNPQSGEAKTDTTTANLDVRAVLQAERDAVSANSTASSAAAPVETPAELSADLLDFSAPPATQKRFNVQADNIPAQHFYADLGRSQDINILVDPSITGTLSLSLRAVTIEQVMNAIRDLYGYDYLRTDYGFRVLPNQIQTRIYQLNYLNIDRSGRSDTTVSSGQITSQESGELNRASSVATQYSANFWSGMETTILGLLNQEAGRQVVVNPQTGLLVVRATPREHDIVANFLADAELSLQKQVVIEAKVLEVTLSSEHSSGINWSAFADDLSVSNITSGLGLGGNALQGPADAGGVFSIGVGSNEFGTVLQLLSNQGDVQVLSSPRVATVNNQKAVIKVGTDEFFVTEVNSSTGDSNGDGIVESTPEFTLSPFFSGIALDVTPQISANDNVILHVRPSVTDVEERTKVINVGGSTYDLPLAFSSVRETDSVIRASSGQIVVIGGLLSQQQTGSRTGVPGLSRVPGFSWLFGQQRDSQNKSELVILLKPIVYGSDTSVDQLDAVLRRLP
ncbi:pilus (MSHA type) biogenesis protein MshL [Saccharospirillum mangrovi]|uniref:pilus (MSHA type) biogenesis protein MshL n=1 Tax=Saccharospirillum mangrovi TaxID=2161747 RepID=UPI000D36DA8C|nr:pilus (MSHA type) biogenesis protein MshL [Saccharospirillum mangrovi]